MPYAGWSYAVRMMDQSHGIFKHDGNNSFEEIGDRSHPTETAVLKVFSDVVDGIEKRKFALLSLLDFTASFDTVDHEILLRRMALTFEIT